jgi:hypothetical protein
LGIKSFGAHRALLQRAKPGFHTGSLAPPFRARGEKSGLEDADLKVGAKKRQAATTGRTPKLSRGQTLKFEIFDLQSKSASPPRRVAASGVQ